jgi:two-component system, response regulator PdtaR
MRQNRSLQRGAEHMPSKAKILVVDDDRLVLATVVHGLSQAGFEVIDADNGDDAILAARQHRPDLSLLDIRMDGKSGFDVAEYLRDYLHLPFMFLSAFADDATVAQVQALGAVEYLVKPLDVGQIVPAVEAALARVRAGASAGGATQIERPTPESRQFATPDAMGLAVGVLMHRYSLPRDQAFERLCAMASSANRTLQEQAELLVSALEELVRTPAA